MADLEEPQIPNLNAGMELGRTMVNAFLSAASVNRQRQALEEKIRESQMHMAMQEQKHDLDIEKLDWQHQFQSANLQRQYDAMHQSAVFADRRAQDTEDKMNWTMSRADARSSDATALRRELSDAASKNPIWSQAFDNEVTAIKGKYDTGTREAQNVIKDFNTDTYRATKEAHTNAALAMKAFNTSLAMQGGQGLNKTDFQRPKEDFVFDKGNVGVAEYPVSVPGPAGTTSSVRWQTVPPSALKKLSSEDQNKQFPGLRWRRTTKENYDNLSALHEQISKYGGTDLREKPRSMEKIPLDDYKARDFLKQAGGDKDEARRLATEAGYDY